MPPPTTIRSLDARLLDLPLLEPFGISRGAQHHAHNLLVTIELEDGTRGLGEAAPFPAFDGETQTATRAAIEFARPRLLGADVRGWREISRELALAAPHSGSARCAVEMAVLDALGRHLGLPLWSLFGGAGTELETDLTVTTGSIDRARGAATAIAARGFSTIKVKIGAASLDEDVARLAAVHEAAPAARLIADANGALDAGSALALCEALRARGIELALFEQPTPAGDLDALAEVTKRSGFLVAADESLRSPADALEIARRGAATVLNIKPMKCGLVAALDIAAVGRAAGLGLMIGAMIESRLSISASACLAAGCGGFSFVDLDTPEWFADSPFEGGYLQDGPRISVGSIARGHGILLLEGVAAI
jgi:L-alanine-DL-glutamate epimerase-like enolase superfamily enzyme